MSEPKIVASAKEKKKAAPVDATQAWAALGWVGLTFMLVGGVDFLLVWYPTNFGSREWEFASVTAAFNGLPVLVMGLAFLLAAGVHTERRWWSALVALVSAGLVLWIVVAVVLWLLTIPLALRTAPVEVLTGLKKALTKTAVQSVAYPTLLVLLGRRALGALRPPTPSTKKTA